MQRPGCRGVTTPRGFSGKRQRALTPSEELDGGLATAITILHITGIIAQVLLLQGVNCQGNGHFLLTKMLLDNPARQTNGEILILEHLIGTVGIQSAAIAEMHVSSVRL